LNCVEIGGKGWLFVAKKMNKEEGEMEGREGKGRFLGHKLNITNDNTNILFHK
jgi:hypothetical protein